MALNHEAAVAGRCDGDRFTVFEVDSSGVVQHGARPALVRALRSDGFALLQLPAGARATARSYRLAAQSFFKSPTSAKEAIIQAARLGGGGASLPVSYLSAKHKTNIDANSRTN